MQVDLFPQSELFEQSPSAVYCELPVVTNKVGNGPPVNENSEDYVSAIMLCIHAQLDVTETQEVSSAETIPTYFLQFK